MKSKRGLTGKGQSAGQGASTSALWTSLTNVRFTLAISAFFLTLCAASFLIVQDSSPAGTLERTYPPELLYLLKQAGLTDIFHSGWFVFVLILLVVNQFCLLVDSLVRGARESQQALPGSVQVDSFLKGKSVEHPVGVEIETGLNREQFRELVQKWSAPRLGRLRVVKDDAASGEIQLAYHRGRFSSFFRSGMHLSILLLVIGGAKEMTSGFEGQVTVEEGSRVRYLQVTHGTARQWPGFVFKGRSLPGFYDPGFEIECSRFRTEDHRAWLNFYQKGKFAGSREIAPNHPAAFQGLHFLSSGFTQTAQKKISMTLKDSQSGEPVQFPNLILGQDYELEGASFRIVDLQDEKADSGMGTSAQLQYREGSETPQKFWVFKRFPVYDEAHRKTSRYHFTLDEIEPRYSTNVKVTSTPGFHWVLAGGTLLVFSIFGAAFFSMKQVWFVWRPGRFFGLAASNQPSLFASEFELTMNQFKGAIARLDKTVKAGPVEVRHGSE